MKRLIMAVRREKDVKFCCQSLSRCIRNTRAVALIIIIILFFVVYSQFNIKQRIAK